MVLFLRKLPRFYFTPHNKLHNIYYMRCYRRQPNRVPTSRVQTPVLLTRHKLICYMCWQQTEHSFVHHRSTKLTDNNYYGSLIFLVRVFIFSSVNRIIIQSEMHFYRLNVGIRISISRRTHLLSY